MLHTEAKSSLLKVLKKSFHKFQELVVTWTNCNSSGQNIVKNMNMLGDTLRSCLTATVDGTLLVRTHPGIREQLLTKLCVDIELERAALKNVLTDMDVIMQKVSSENSMISGMMKEYKGYLNEDDLTEKTEFFPSISQMVNWINDINTVMQKQFSDLNCVTETTDFSVKNDATIFSTIWKQEDYMTIISDALASVHFFLLET